MEIKIEEAIAGNGIKLLFNGILDNSTILEIDHFNKRVKADYFDKEGRHKRDQWMPFSSIITCQRSDIDISVKEIIIKEITQKENLLNMSHQLRYDNKKI